MSEKMQGNNRGKLMLCLDIKEKWGSKGYPSQSVYKEFFDYYIKCEDERADLKKTICDQAGEIERLNLLIANIDNYNNGE